MTTVTSPINVSSQPIDSQLTLLENNLLKFKLTLSQLTAKEIPPHFISPQLAQQINSITYYVNAVGAKIEGEMKMIRGRVIGELEQIRQEREYEKWNQAKLMKELSRKVTGLEEQLGKMRGNEETLINAINILMQRHQIEEQPTIIRDHEYLSSRVVQSVVTPHQSTQNTSFQHSHIEKLQQLSSSLAPTPTSYPNINNQFASNSQLAPNQFMRTFAQGKTSLKYSNRSDGTTASGPRLAPAPRTNATVSLDKNDHRFRFMMRGLQKDQH